MPPPQMAVVSMRTALSTPPGHQVPKEISSKPPPPARTPATADAVSCDPTAITGSGRAPAPAPPSTSRSTSPRTSPTWLPGWRSGGDRPRGSPARGLQGRAPGRGPPPRGAAGGAGVVSPPAPARGPRPGLAGEPVPDQVRDQQQRSRGRELRRAPRGDQLVDGVERKLSGASGLVHLPGTERGVHPLGDARGAGVPVVHRVAEQRAARV